LQEGHKFGDRYAAVVAAEAFNLFNHWNYNATVTSTSYGTPADHIGGNRSPR